MLIDRRKMRDSLHNMQQLVDAAIEGIVVAKNDRIVSVNQRLADCAAFPARADRKKPRRRSHRHADRHGRRSLAAHGVAARRVPVNVVRRRLSVGDDVYTIHDLTERRAVEMELQRQNKALQEREEELRSRNLLLDTALMHMSQGLCMYDKDQRVVVCNERYATLYRLTPEDVKPGTTRRAIVERRIALGVWGGASPEAYLRDRTAVVDTSSYSIQEMNDGRSIATAHVPMPGGGWVCTHEDITERRQAQAKIEHLARHDGLTNLPNRVLVRERLQEALSRLRPGEGLAVHAIDLDRFKEVNDALGHVVGDELLQAVAERLAEVGERGRHARAHGRRRIRHRAEPGLLADGRKRPREPDHRRDERALHPGGAVPGRARREHRHRHGARRRHRCRPAPEGRQPGALPCQGGGARQVPLLRARDGRAHAGAARYGAQLARRARQRRARSRLSAAPESEAQRAVGLRGADALAHAGGRGDPARASSSRSRRRRA